MKILIADDDALSRRLLERTLARAGYEVIAVENGRLAAAEMCRPDGPRLALLDWVMPELDGPAVCREVRRQRGERHVHLVLLTSKDSKQDIISGLESGADDYLVKPFDPGELRARLRSGIRILELEDTLLEAREELRFKATHDSLTTLLNRGAILEVLTREMTRTRREKTPITILLADIDHFKSVNDTHGHPVGDEVLAQVARRLMESVRPYDFVGRYGGEEFLVVLNRCGAERALIRAEQIRTATGLSPISTSAGALPVTLSLGACTIAGDGLRTIEEVLSSVDHALYEAKAAGRNCCRQSSIQAGQMTK